MYCTYSNNSTWNNIIIHCTVLYVKEWTLSPVETLITVDKVNSGLESQRRYKHSIEITVTTLLPQPCQVSTEELQCYLHIIVHSQRCVIVWFWCTLSWKQLVRMKKVPGILRIAALQEQRGTAVQRSAIKEALQEHQRGTHIQGWPAYHGQQERASAVWREI